MERHFTIETLLDKLIKQCSKCPTTPCLSGYVCSTKQKAEQQLRALVKQKER